MRNVLMSAVLALALAFPAAGVASAYGPFNFDTDCEVDESPSKIKITCVNSAGTVELTCVFAPSGTLRDAQLKGARGNLADLCEDAHEEIFD